jgi:hypothetical protein
VGGGAFSGRGCKAPRSGYLTGGEILSAHDYRNEGKRWCGLLMCLVLFRLMAPPLSTRVVKPYPVWSVWLLSRLLLEGTIVSRIFGRGTRGTRP